MKKFTFLLTIAVAVAAVGFAKVHAVKSFTTASEPQVLNVKFDMPRDLNSKSLKAPARAEEDYVVITEQPEGDLKTYKRGGGQYVVSGTSLSYGDQSGTIDIVWADNNKVYFKDIVSTLPVGTWVEGTVSEDGTTITVPLRQNLYYHPDYDACIAINLLNYTSEGFAIDTEATEVTFTIEGDVLSLQGTGFASVSLGATWTDDNSIQAYGDYESVYSLYIPNLDLVTLPEGVEYLELPYEASYYSSVSSSSATQVNSTVKVARVGDEVYIQGMSKELPEAWLKGTITGDQVVIPQTYIGEIDGDNVWACGYDGGLADITMIYDAERNTYELMGYMLQSLDELTFDTSALAGFYQAAYIGTRPDPVMVPDGLQAEDMPYSGQLYDGSTTADFNGTVKVGVDGQNVYIQGLISLAPEAWVMGTMNEDGTKLTIPAGQYVGYCQYGSIYMVGDSEDTEGVADITFTYDKNENTYTLDNNAYINGKKNAFYYYNVIMSGLVIGNPSDAMWVAAEQNYENEQAVYDITIGEGVTGHIEEGASPNPPRYYDNGVSLRLYAGHEFTITSDKPMVKILITMDHASANQQVLEANMGDYELINNVGTWTGESNSVTFTVPAGKQARISKIQIYFLDYATTLVTVPEDLQTETYRFSGVNTYNNNEELHPVEVGFDGDYVYIQGLSKYLPEAWVRGEIKNQNGSRDGNVTYVFPNWYLGHYTNWFSFDLVFSGCDMTYDPEADQFYCDSFTSIDPTDPSFAWDEYEAVFIYKVKEVEATPMDPEIVSYTPESSYPYIRLNIPLIGTEGEDLIEDYVTYVIYIYKDGKVTPLVFSPEDYRYLTEEMVEIPYNFSDDWDIYAGGATVYLNQSDVAEWDNIGVQVFYSGGGVEHASNIVWYDQEQIPSAVTEVAAADGQAFYYDLQGRQADENTTGILIKQTRDAQGNVIKVEKVLNK